LTADFLSKSIVLTTRLCLQLIAEAYTFGLCRSYTIYGHSEEKGMGIDHPAFVLSCFLSSSLLLPWAKITASAPYSSLMAFIHYSQVS
jgi:hypothetical protein